MALFEGKTKCAPLCALFGQIRCAFEFRIIEPSGNNQQRHPLASTVDTTKIEKFNFKNQGAENF